MAKAKRGGPVRSVDSIYHNRNFDTGVQLVQPIRDEAPSPSNTEELQRKTDQAWLGKSRSSRLKVEGDMPGGPGTFEPRDNSKFQ